MNADSVRVGQARARERDPRATQRGPLTAVMRAGHNAGGRRGRDAMKYFTTLEVANELKVSKQTLLNWLYARKVPEPPRNRNGYRLWSPARVSLVKKLIGDGRIHRRTVIHREASRRPEVVTEIAREGSQFLRDADIALRRFVRELHRVHDGRARRPRRRRR